MENYTICNCKSDLCRRWKRTSSRNKIRERGKGFWRCSKNHKVFDRLRRMSRQNYGHNISNNEQINLKTKEEVFTMKKYECPCGYVYDPAVGDPDNGIAPGTAWEDVPEDWCVRFAAWVKTHSRKNNQTIAKRVCALSRRKSFFMQ